MKPNAVTLFSFASALLVGQGVCLPAQSEAQSEPFSPLQHMQIQVATRIEGRLLTLDPYDDAIWVAYTRFFDGRSWRLVPYEAELLLYARDADMMKFFRSLPKGTMLRMTIFIDEEGRRLVAELEGT